MGKIYFLVGGARSGKSQYSEELALSISEKVGYLATAEIIDEEMEKRVEFHRKRRPGSWETFEVGKNEIEVDKIKKIIDEAVARKLDVLLIDCITILLFRFIYKPELDDLEVMDNKLEREIETKVEDFFEMIITCLKKASVSYGLNIIIVSNEVGMGVVPPYPFGRIFRDMLGLINKKIAGISDEVYFFVSGLNMRIK
jgi:adenosylcobinamide kinase/adenosylcobinamide-phosphate guanylyltransferase